MESMKSNLKCIIQIMEEVTRTRARIITPTQITEIITGWLEVI